MSPRPDSIDYQHGHEWRLGFWLWSPSAFANLGLITVAGSIYLLRLGFGLEFIGLQFAVGKIAFGLACLWAPRLGRALTPRQAMRLGLVIVGVFRCMFVVCELVPESGRASFVMLTSAFANAGLAIYYTNKAPYMMGIGSLESQRRFFSLEQAYVYASTFLGSLAAGYLPVAFALLLDDSLATPAPYRYPIVIGGLISILGAAMLPSLEAAPAASTTTASREPPEPGSATPIGVMVTMAIAYGLVMTGHNISLGFFNAYLDHGLHVSPARNGEISALASLLAAPAALLAPAFTRRWGRSLPYTLVALAMAVGLAMIGLGRDWTVAAAGFLVLSVAGAIRSPIQNHFYMVAVAPRQRAAMSAAMLIVLQVNGALVGLAGGLGVDALGYEAVFLVSAAVTAAGGLMISQHMRST